MRIVEAFVAQEGALAIGIEIGAVVALRDPPARKSARPCPAALRDGDALDHPRLRPLGADLFAGRRAALVVRQRRAASLVAGDGDAGRPFLAQVRGAGAIVDVRGDLGLRDFGRTGIELCVGAHRAQPLAPAQIVSRPIAARAHLDLCVTDMRRGRFGATDARRDLGGHHAVAGKAVTLVLVAHAVVEIALGVDDGRHEPRGASLRTFGYLRPLVADRLVIAFGTGTGRQRRTGAVLATQLLSLEIGIGVVRDRHAAPRHLLDLGAREARAAVVGVGHGAEVLVGGRDRPRLGGQAIRIAEIGRFRQRRALVSRQFAKLSLARQIGAVGTHRLAQIVALAPCLLLRRLCEAAASSEQRTEEREDETLHAPALLMLRSATPATPAPGPRASTKVSRT